MTETIWRLLAVAFFVLLNGFFVAAEFALVKIRKTQLDPLALRGHRRAQIALRVIQNLDSSLSACQVGITVASLALGWLGEPVFQSLLAPVWDGLRVGSPAVRQGAAIVIGFALITFLHITAGEQAPKWFAIQKPLPTSLWVAAPLEWFQKLAAPLIWLLNRASQALLHSLGLEHGGESAENHSEEELRWLYSAMQKQQGGSALGREIVLNAMDLRRRIAREVMRPRQEIAFLDSRWSMAECLNLAEKTHYSRFPLCQSGDIDKSLGVIHIKDLYGMRFKVKKAEDLAPAARKLIYVPEAARLEGVLRLFLDRKLHFAIVVDEYGGTVGMVTLENILEELVGQIQDEFDQEKPLLRRKDDRTWEIDGALPLHELSELAGQPLEEEGISTASGFVTQRLGGFPKVGDHVALGMASLRVEAMDGMRVARLSLQRRELAEPPPETASDAENDSA